MWSGMVIGGRHAKTIRLPTVFLASSIPASLAPLLLLFPRDQIRKWITIKIKAHEIPVTVLVQCGIATYQP